MNYCEREKVVSDLELEFDLLYNILCLLSDYTQIKDLITDRNTFFAKINLINATCCYLRQYMNSPRMNTTNNSVISNRRKLDPRLKEFYLKLISDKFILEDLVFN